jgi:hypothetical protein
MIRTPMFWFVLLATLCVVAPYLLGVPPRRRRDWMLLTATIAFLAWLLGGFASVRTETLVLQR